MEAKERRGFLSVKRGTGLGAWKQRFFVVEDGRCTMYKDNSMLVKELEMDLLECAGGGVNAKSGLYPKKQFQDYAFSFESRDGSEFFLCAESLDEKLAWIDALSENIQLARKKQDSMVPSGPINAVKPKLVAKSAGAESEISAPPPANSPRETRGESKPTLEKDKSTTATTSLKLENENLRKDLAGSKSMEQSLRKELELVKKLYKEAKEQKASPAVGDTDWIEDSSDVSSSTDVGLLKKQLGVLAKKAGRMRKQIEDLEDENEVLREEVQDLQSQLATRVGTENSQKGATELDLQEQLAELEQMLEETAQRQLRYEKYYKMYKVLKDKYEPDEEGDDDELQPAKAKFPLVPGVQQGEDRLSGSYMSLHLLGENTGDLSGSPMNLK